MRLAPLAAAATAVCALALPGLAHAVTYCVNSPGCSGTPEADLQTALTAAQTSTGVADTVMVGSPGTPPSAGYHYNGAADNPVDIVGAGTSATTLTATDTGSIALFLTGTTSSVSHLTLRLPAGGSYGMQTNAASITDVDVTSADPGSASQIGVYMFGHGQTWAGGHITMPATGSQTGVYASTAGVTFTLQDLSIAGAGIGVLGANGSFTLRRVSLFNGVGLGTNSENVVADNVLYRPIPSAPNKVFFGGDVSLADVTVDLNHVTAAGDGTSPSIGITMVATGGRSATVNLRNSIVRGFQTSIDREANGAGSVANVNLAYSDLDSGAARTDTNTSGGTGAIIGGFGLIDADPKWTNPAAPDFTLLSGSPAIDTGDPAGIAGGESATDLAGKPRLIGTRTDLGAFEFQPSPVVPPVVPDKTPPTMRLSRIPKKLRPKQLVTGFSFTVTPSEAASLDATLAGSARSAHLAKSYNITLAHKRTSRSTATRRITLRAKKKLVGSSRRFSVRLTLVATDAAGNKRTIRRTIKVRK